MIGYRVASYRAVSVATSSMQEPICIA